MLKAARASGPQVSRWRSVSRVAGVAHPSKARHTALWPAGGASPHTNLVPSLTSLSEILPDCPFPKERTTCFTRLTRMPFRSGPSRAARLPAGPLASTPRSCARAAYSARALQRLEQVWASAVCCPAQGSPHPPFPAAAAQCPASLSGGRKKREPQVLRAASHRRGCDAPGETSPGWLSTGTQLRTSGAVES